MATSFRAVAGDDAHHRVIGANGSLFTEFFHTRRSRDAGRFAEDAAGTAQELLGGHNFLVGDIDHQTIGLPNGHQRFLGVAGHADGNGIGQGVLLHGLPGLILGNGPVRGQHPAA